MLTVSPATPPCAAAPRVTPRAAVQCCPSCHHRAAACWAVVCCPCRRRHAAPCVLGRGVLPTSLPPLRCPSCRHRVCVRPQCATRIAATAVLPPACRAVVCCLCCHHRCTARRIAIEWLRVGLWCAAHVAAAMLPPACRAVVCCPYRRCRRAARRVAIECVSGCSVLPTLPPPLCCPLRVGLWCAARIATTAVLPVVSPLSGCMSGHGVLPTSSLPPRCPLCRCQAVVCSSVLLPASPPPPRCFSCRCWAIACCAAVCHYLRCCCCSRCAACHLTVRQLCVVPWCDLHHHHTARRVTVGWLCVVQ